jgi:hypothetical protein
MKYSYFKKLSIILVCLFLIIVLIYFYKVYQINQLYLTDYENGSGIHLRKFPYPYQAALTICSDCDATSSADEFLTIQRYLNSKDSTSIGDGIGLEIGNSFFMYDPVNRFSLLSGDTTDRKIITQYLRQGFIDCLHSYGEKYDFTRKDAENGLAQLSKINCMLDVWIDHSFTIDNIDEDIMGGEGDQRNSCAYHSDLTINFGFKFFWLGRVSSTFVHEVPIQLSTFINIWDSDFIYNSLINIGKEFSKHMLGVFGFSKYLMHKDYRLVQIRTLSQGQKVFEFIRTNSHWGGVNRGDDTFGLAYVLSEKNLELLKKKQGYSIIYTHLGKNSSDEEYIAEKTKKALQNLAKESQNGNIYVTTTSKLLNYYINRKNLIFDIDKRIDSTYININGIYDPLKNKVQMPTINELQGITFYTSQPHKTVINLLGKKIYELQLNPADDSGQKSLMFPLKRIINFKD